LLPKNLTPRSRPFGPRASALQASFKLPLLMQTTLSTADKYVTRLNAVHALITMTYRRRSGRFQSLREFEDHTCIYRDYILHTATSTPRRTFHRDHSQGPTNSRPGPKMRGLPSGRMSTTELHTPKIKRFTEISHNLVIQESNNRAILTPRILAMYSS